MGGIEAASGNRTSSWDDHENRIAKESAARSSVAPRAIASAPWAHDGSRIPEAIRSYDPSMFTNPSLQAPPVAPVAAAAAPVLASAPDPLPPAADAYQGIHLACLAGDLPRATQTDRANIIRVGAYTLHPSVRIHEDGSKSLLYWTAVNGAEKRAEFVIGPGSLDTFKREVSSFENAGATAYMNGEPNEWQRLSMKTVDDAMRKGPLAAAGTLKAAWSAAVRDPAWWGQTLLAASTAFAAGGAASKAESVAGEEAAAARSARARAGATAPGPHTPLVEGGGLMAHEGGAVDAHLIRRHVGKTTAELEARFTPKNTLKASSSFFDRAQAEAAVSKTLVTNEAQLTEWMKSPSTDALRLEYHPTGPAFPVGVSMSRGGAALPVAGVRVVLLKDASMSCGFRILTGYPVP